jgi:serine/threonine-protein kinase RsbW
VTPRHPEQVRLDFPARHMYLHLLSDCIAAVLRRVEGLRDAETLLYNVQLATHEACTNIIRHAYNQTGEGRIEIVLTLQFAQPACLTIDLYDTGRAFDSDAYTPPDLDKVQEYGYGLFLIRNLMDSVSYTPTVGRNHWRLIKKLFVEGM